MDLNQWQLYAVFAAEALAFVLVFFAVTTPAWLLGARAAAPFRRMPNTDWLAEYAKRPGTFALLSFLHNGLALLLIGAWAAVVTGQVHALLAPPRVYAGWLYVIAGIVWFSVPVNLMNPKVWRRRATAFTPLLVFLGTMALVVFLIWPGAARATLGWLTQPLGVAIASLRGHAPWIPTY